MTRTTTLMTADDLLALPKDEFRYELIEGELHKMEPAGFFHGATGNRLNGRLTVYVEDHDLGVVVMAETGFKVQIDPDTVLAPDTAFVAKANLPEPWPKYGFFHGVPDLERVRDSNLSGFKGKSYPEIRVQRLFLGSKSSMMFRSWRSLAL